VGISPEVRYRMARVDDARAVAAYHHRCWSLAYGPLFGQALVDGLDPERRVPVFEWWFDPNDVAIAALVAEVDGTPVGHTVVGGHEVIHVFVDPDHWRQGIGQCLLDRAEATVRSNGHEVAELHVVVGNAPAIAMYERAGWVLTDRVVSSEVEGGIVLHEHVMEKPVG
jgi:GNAT superfamily N-acetyltransferase